MAKDNTAADGRGAGGARLILASASPRRRELLARLGLPFEVVPADVVEHEPPGSDDPRGLVEDDEARAAGALVDGAK